MKKIALWLIRFYKKYLSLLFPSQCRFQPTCSDYTYRQIEENGILRGSFAGVRRILSCHG